MHGTIPVLLQVPHAGLESFFDSSDIETGRIAEEMGAAADLNTDWIARLASSAMEGAPYLLQSNMTRMECDVEKPRMRADDNMGAIYRTGMGGLEDRLYSCEIPQKIIDCRIEALYEPYHRMFGSMVREMVERFGFAAIISIHSHGNGWACCETCSDDADIRIIANDEADGGMVESIISHEEWNQRRSCSISTVSSGAFTPRRMGHDSRIHPIMLEFRKDAYMDGRMPMYASMDSLGMFIARLSSRMLDVLDSAHLDRLSAARPETMIPAADTR